MKSKLIFTLIILAIASRDISAQGDFSSNSVQFSVVPYLLDTSDATEQVVLPETQGGPSTPPKPSCDDCQTASNLTITVEPSSKNENNGRNINSIFQLTFNSGGEAVRIGQFINGDYWISPAKGSNYIDITSLNGNGQVSGSINPQLESHGIGSGTKNYGSYDPSKNVVNKLPLRIDKDSSLVLAMVRDEGLTSKCGTKAIEGECIDTYLVITYLSDPPVDNGISTFRPPISSSIKPLLTWADIELSKMASNPILVSPSASDYEKIRNRWAHTTDVLSIWHSEENYYSEGGRAFRAHNMVDDYAAGQARSWNDSLFAMMSSNADRSSEAWKSAFASMLSYGLDNYHAIHSAELTRYYGSGAGQHLGPFPTSVWAAHVIKDSSPYSSYRSTLSTVSGTITANRNTGPHELEQINEGRNGVALWGDARTSSPPIITAWADLFNSGCYDGSPKSCSPTGNKAQKDPYGQIDGPMSKPGSSYMGVSFGLQESFVALACLSPGMAEIINYRPLFEYVDRVKASGILVRGDGCAPPPPNESDNCNPYKIRLETPGTASEYQAITGCNFIGEDWGPDPVDPQNRCIENNSNGRTGQTGRFGNLGSIFTANTAYVSSQVNSNFAVFRGNSAYCELD